MRFMNAVSPIVFAFLCGYHLPDLAWAIDTKKGIHSATDLYVWIIVPVAGIAAILGAWRAYKNEKPAQTSK